ncbi:universal stress -like isoform X1 [Olea europaea subsp. europaea]|uniref:Universal stress -like isoform X1 n=1 Tax=Olea europaea subsp. europaea TaxID=158383 RepID=A0A8S0P9A9_OLEEU|nr:universal stress -like isoform X1 [Olea europaea subsp. europaea]
METGNGGETVEQRPIAVETGKRGLMAGQEPEGKKMMNIMVAIDDSHESFYALEWVLDKLLKYSGGAAPQTAEEQEHSKVVTMVHVIEPMPRHAFPSGGYVVESASKTQEQNGARILSRGFDMCRDKMVIAKTLILEGDPKDRICRAIDEMNIDLLVVGSRGLGQIKRAFLGSVSDYCAHHAKCAVLVVKPTKKHD